MEKIQHSEHFREICHILINSEPIFGEVISVHGYPPFWHREPGFATLILTILEQQVSLASARAAYNKLLLKTGTITPENILSLTEQELKACYFSRQKTAYSRNLAREITEGKLDLAKLNNKSAPEIRNRLIQLKGIGNWTIDMYLIMSLHFSDIFPAGDLATIKAVYELNLLPAEAQKEDIIDFMKRYSPYQSVATYILWHSYIQKRNLALD